MPVQISDFKDKVAVITGAGQGLGRSYAILLASLNAKVVINDIAVNNNISLAQELTREINNSGGVATADLNSVATEEGVRNLIKSTYEKYERIDILIHNAGILINRSIFEMTGKDWDAVIDVHLNGAFYLIKEVLPVMDKQNYGRIVLITSSAGLYGLPFQSNYAAAKMGVIGFLNAFKAEIQNKNIYCNAVSPLASSLQTINALGPELESYFKPELVAPMVAYLCSFGCVQNGNIYVAGGGYFSRIGLFEGEGVTLNPDGLDIEAIAANIDKINDMSGARHISSILQAAKKILRRFLVLSKNRK